jgi:hypothetical protein
MNTGTIDTGMVAIVRRDFPMVMDTPPKRDDLDVARERALCHPVFLVAKSPDHPERCADFFFGSARNGPIEPGSARLANGRPAMTADKAPSVKCENCGGRGPLVTCACGWPGCELLICQRCVRTVRRNLELEALGRIVLAKPKDSP